MILKVHSRGKPMAPDIDLLSIARRTPGFTGADLANVLNEAALLTARQNQKLIGNRALDEAIDRVIAGPQRSSRLMSETEKLITAYHEGGHALVAAALPGTDPVHKITILPRGRALGYDGAARRGQVLPDPLRDARQARLHAGRPGGRGDGLPRPHHRRRQRHREGDRAGAGHGHAVRHDRAARRDQAGRVQLRAVPGPRLRAPAQLLRGRRRDHRRGDQEFLATAHRRPSTSSRRTATSWTPWCWRSSTRRPSTRPRSPPCSSRCVVVRRARPGPGPPTATRPRSRRSRSRRRSRTGSPPTGRPRPRAASSSRRPDPAATCTGTWVWAAAPTPPTEGA